MADGGDIADRDWARRGALAAEERCPAWASCRTLPRRRLARWGVGAGVVGLGALLAAPLVTLTLAAMIAALTLILTIGLKLAAATASLRRSREDEVADVDPATLPVISILVPLYRETAIAHHLMARMEALDYPRHLLDLCLLVEDDDAQTRAAIEDARVPHWARIVEVPEGTLRTKPRALNYGLEFSRGSIVGIYDAEDVPAPDHLLRVAHAFAALGPEVACLQGVLDYFNARRNWLARCFTIEYAAWFRVVLPGLVRLGLVVPLGGTTLFLRDLM